MPEFTAADDAVASAFLLAGLVKGVIGLGLPTIAVGLLSLVMPPMEAAAILIVPSLLTNIWQVVAGRQPLVTDPTLGADACRHRRGDVWRHGLHRHGQRHRRDPFARPGTGDLLVSSGSPKFRLIVPPSTERWLSPLIGFANGLITTATGIFVIPATPYVQALNFEKDDLVQALGIMFLVSTMALALTLRAIWHADLWRWRAGRCWRSPQPLLEWGSDRSCAAVLRRRRSAFSFFLVCCCSGFTSAMRVALS